MYSDIDKNVINKYAVTFYLTAVLASYRKYEDDLLDLYDDDDIDTGDTTDDIYAGLRNWQYR